MLFLRRLLRYLLVVWLCLWAAVAGASDLANEVRVKSAVVYNLLQFVSWPKAYEETGSLSLCLLEDSPMFFSLRTYQGRKVSNLSLLVRAVPAGLLGGAGCQAVFVEAGDPSLLMRAANLVGMQPVLVIGEGGGAISRGAMIGIDTDAGKVAFTVDLAALRHRGLKVSSKLLLLAKQVLE